MRKFLSASLLAISSALPAMADQDVPLINTALSPVPEGNYYTDCVRENLEEQFPEAAVTVDTRELRDGSTGFSIKAPFEDALWRPNGISIYGAQEDTGLIERITLSARDSSGDTTRTQYHSRDHDFGFFQNYSSHELSQFSETFKNAVQAISACATTDHEAQNNAKQITANLRSP